MLFDRLPDRCVIFICILPPSHYYMLNIWKENENRNKNHTSIYKFHHDSFDSRNVAYILYI